MPLREDDKLDNPVWHSLNETHAPFALTYGGLKCYQTDHCPFGGYISGQKIAENLDHYANHIADFYIVGEQPAISKHISLKQELICLQMTIDSTIDLKQEEKITTLNKEHEKELFALVNLVQPGYFRTKTMQLGTYYGIFKNHALVAATGERMKMNTFTEVSAVVTHPDHTGRGYAKQLVAHAVNHILEQGRIPFLHVAETNKAAFSLYKKLGFGTRRKMSFWNYIKTAMAPMSANHSNGII